MLNCLSESLGDCSFLNTCFHMDTCKYVHYEIDYPEKQPKLAKAISAQKHPLAPESSTILFPAQVDTLQTKVISVAIYNVNFH